MAVDWDSLVLAPAMAVFAQPVTITPVKSQPLAPPYQARGIIDVKSLDIPLEDGAMLSSRTIRFGIRMSEFALPPRQGDWITAKASDIPLAWWQGFSYDPNGTVDFTIDDVRPDGQGGADLMLKRFEKPDA